MFARPSNARRPFMGFALATLLAVPLAGCDLEALLADPKIAQREADAKAIGGACRHAMRSIEDCYALNDKASRAAVFSGWKDMDQYMRDNNIEGITPQGVKAAIPAVAASDEEIVASDPKGKGRDKEKAKAASGANEAAKPSAKTEK